MTATTRLHDIAAMGMGLALLCGATIALIGGTGLFMWVAGV